MKTLDAETFLGLLSAKAAASRRPEGVTFELTYGCNLRCLHCYNPTHRMLPHELTTSEVCSVLDQIAGLGVLNVTFTGGEPSVRPDIVHILRHARSQGLVLQLMTNATRMTPSFVTVLREVGISQINVSIYGATEQVYERMTSVAGSYAQFQQGLRLLDGGQLRVIVRMPVTTVNQEEIGACRALVEDHGFKFQYCLDVMPRTDGDCTPLQYRLNPEDKHRIDHDLLPPSLDGIVENTCSSSSSFIKCACGKSRFAITPYGEMNLCVAFPIPKYNLRKGNVKEGWEVLKHAVDRAVPTIDYKCPTCEVRPHCRQGRSDAWLETGDMSSCLPHFKEWAEQEHRTHALLDPRRPR
jgi:radical SAM protein with 4Fe4S-binding SPASM domain